MNYHQIIGSPVLALIAFAYVDLVIVQRISAIPMKVQVDNNRDEVLEPSI